MPISNCSENSPGAVFQNLNLKPVSNQRLKRDHLSSPISKNRILINQKLPQITGDDQMKELIALKKERLPKNI